MAKVATRRIKVHGQWVLPGQAIPDSVKAAEAKQLIADGFVRDEVTPAEAARAAKLAEKLAEMQDKRTALEGEMASRQARLAEIAAMTGDEAKAAEKEQKKLAAEVARIQSQLDEVVAALKLLE